MAVGCQHHSRIEDVLKAHDTKLETDAVKIAVIETSVEQIKDSITKMEGAIIKYGSMVSGTSLLGFVGIILTIYLK